MTPSAEPQRLEVSLGARSYPILVGSGLLDRSDLLAERVAGRQVLIVTDENVATRYLDRALTGLVAAAGATATMVLPPGEDHKTPATWSTLLDRLVSMQAHRDAVVLALGGGVVGDLAGFAAATYMRGIDFLQCPTTLLAQVDASVGGKTAVNHPQGKNLIGAFHQPRAVVIDVATLSTLPQREYGAGLAETIKYGAIVDAEFFDWIESGHDALSAHAPEALIEAVTRACRCKARIVAADEREQGVRALLNFGHTFGHAIETVTGYQRYLHGEAVAIGMCLAAALSRRLGLCATEVPDRLRALLKRLGLPTRLPADVPTDRLWQAMQLDKKNREGRVRLVLIGEIGRCFIEEGVPEREILATLRGNRAEVG